MSLTPPEQPDLLAPAGPRPIAGDWSDDDGSAIDEYFEPAVSGPLEVSYVDVEETVLPTTQRILSRSIPFTFADYVGTSVPILALPADPDRTELIVSHLGSVDVAIIIASEKSGCYTDAQFALRPQSPTVHLGKYTGAVWIRAVSSSMESGGVTLSVVAITR